MQALMDFREGSFGRAPDIVAERRPAEAKERFAAGRADAADAKMLENIGPTEAQKKQNEEAARTNTLLEGISTDISDQLKVLEDAPVIQYEPLGLQDQM